MAEKDCEMCGEEEVYICDCGCIFRKIGDHPVSPEQKEITNHQ